jgi:DNA polymerase III delta prime subunit
LDREKRILTAFAANPRPGQNWIFYGDSGVGKTTMALALALEMGGEVHHIPSQKCTVENIEDVCRMCWYATYKVDGFHVVIVDEADQMTEKAQLALLSKLDSTAPPPQTIFIFTCNKTDGLEKRFLSRCSKLEFSNYGMRGELAAFLAKVYESETGKAGALNFERIAKESTNNVREALNRLEVELLAA